MAEGPSVDLSRDIRVAILNEFGQVEIFGNTCCTRNSTLINISCTDFPVASWLDLPQDITAAILHKLGPVEIIRTAQLVCKQWWSVCRDYPFMWRCIPLISPAKGSFRSEKISKYAVDWSQGQLIEKICKYAADRSQGQLIDVNINFYCHNDLLLYISQRSSSIRRLQLIHPCCVSSEGIIEAVKNLPLLEELHLYLIHMEAEAIEAIGRSCPLLKSFKLNYKWNYYQWEWEYKWERDLLARAIAEYMPELRHLQLIGNRMTNEGVLAILNGCSHIESLDLRRCFNVRFGGDIEILCLQRIKDLRRPRDPTDDYPFDVQSDNSYWSDDYYGYWSDDDYWMDELCEQNELAYDDIFELRKTPSRKKIKGIMKKIKAKKMKDAHSQWPVSILKISDSEREILTPPRKKIKGIKKKIKAKKMKDAKSKWPVSILKISDSEREIL